MEASGVDALPKLARRNPAELTKKMADVAAAKRLTRRTPNEAEMSQWVAQAKALPRALDY